MYMLHAANIMNDEMKSMLGKGFSRKLSAQPIISARLVICAVIKVVARIVSYFVNFQYISLLSQLSLSFMHSLARLISFFLRLNITSPTV